LHDALVQFPEPTSAAPSRVAVFLTYLDYFRTTIIDKVLELPDGDLRSSRLPSDWTPLELLQHLTHVERRWLEWGFEDPALPDPWGDQREGRWHVDPGASRDEIVSSLRDRGTRTRQIVLSHDLTDVGLPGKRWDGAQPASLERVLFHLLQEYARHAGHLDIVAELSTGSTGE
jgi:uncharacterized damage-inducible protein DinB